MDAKVQLATMIKEAKHIVAFTGAGVSTESGIPDFRSSGGVYDQLNKMQYSGEEALHVDFLERYPELFFKNYRKTLEFPDAQPNFGHIFFKKLEESGKKVDIITQNIDHLHQATGIKNVWPVHGNASKWKVHHFNEPVTKNEMVWDEKGIARNQKGELIRPDIVLYGEPLDEVVFQKAWEAIAEADLLIVIGTGLNVFPAAGLLDAFSGGHSVLINRTNVPSLQPFDLIFQESSGELLKEVWEEYLTDLHK